MAGPLRALNEHYLRRHRRGGGGEITPPTYIRQKKANQDRVKEKRTPYCRKQCIKLAIPATSFLPRTICDLTI